MSSFTLFILIICIIAILFLVINLGLAPHDPYQEKYSMFECGFHSFQQTRSPFNITFFIYALVYLLLDLEITLLFPYAMSGYVNSTYGLLIALLFISLVTIGFIYELGKGALYIPSKQNSNIAKTKELTSLYFIYRLKGKNN
jgi:NADH-ubiquinone oxidoreductase chain 3